MAKEKLLAARQLIQEKHYDEARAILRTVDHPTAREWLAKLEKRASITTPTPKKKRYTLRRTLFLIFGVIVTLIVALIVLREVNYSQYLESIRVTAGVDLRLYCTFSTSLSDVRCDEYVFQAFAQNRDWIYEAHICGSIYNPISETERFGRCLASNGVPLP